MGDIAVRFVEKRDVTQLSQVLARAFFDDPVMVWMIPDETRRVRALERMFGAMTRHHFLAGGGAEVAVDAGERAPSAPRRCGIRPGAGNRPHARSCG